MRKAVSMLDKIFKRSKKAEPDITSPGILFGRYSDNNKPVAKVEKWNEADALFKAKKYYESIEVFFDYLRDDELENVTIETNSKGERGEHGERFSTPTHVRGCAHAMEDGEKRSPPSSPSQSSCSSTACTGEHAGEHPSPRSPDGAPPDWLKEVL